MKEIYKALTLFIVVFIIGLIAKLPVSFVANKLIGTETLKSAGVELSGLSGSIWNGRSESVTFNGKQIGAVAWDSALFSLFTGAVAADIKVNGDLGYLNTRVSISFNQKLRLESMQGKLKAAFLAMNLTSFPVTAEGDLLVDITTLEIRDNKPTTVDGRIVWSGAAVVLIERVELGTIVTELSTNDETSEINADIKDGGDVLDLKSTIKLSEDSSYAITGTVAARRTNDRALINALNMFGRSQGGVVQINRSGKL